METPVAVPKAVLLIQVGLKIFPKPRDRLGLLRTTWTIAPAASCGTLRCLARYGSARRVDRKHLGCLIAVVLHCILHPARLKRQSFVQGLAGESLTEDLAVLFHPHSHEFGYLTLTVTYH